MPVVSLISNRVTHVSWPESGQRNFNIHSWHTPLHSDMLQLYTALARECKMCLIWPLHAIWYQKYPTYHLKKPDALVWRRFNLLGVLISFPVNETLPFNLPKLSGWSGHHKTCGVQGQSLDELSTSKQTQQHSERRLCPGDILGCHIVSHHGK